MRIGLIAPPWISVPPPAYGGTEIVIDNLARGLRRRGHDVVLFTVADSTCPVTRRFLYRHNVAPMGDSAHEAAHVLAAYDALHDVDIIHDHTVLGALLARRSGRHGPPVVVTNHNPFDFEARAVLGRVAGWAHIVAISRAQALSAAPIPVSAVIHHGIDLDTYRLGPGGGNYLLFIGRMCADKGVHRAVRVAAAAGLPLHIVTKMRSPAEFEYFHRYVEPLLGPDDPRPVELPLKQRLELLRSATALLDPIRWPEPFGLVMAESLAAGTPVLAFPYGAAPEIIDSGRTGFLCTDERDMVATVDRVGELDRNACRAAAEQRFGLDRMAEDHIRLYERVRSGSPARGTLLSERADGAPRQLAG
jgi:glycosyltransferase involved in cell wall biosynthesis